MDKKQNNTHTYIYIYIYMYIIICRLPLKKKKNTSDFFSFFKSKTRHYRYCYYVMILRRTTRWTTVLGQVLSLPKQMPNAIAPNRFSRVLSLRTRENECKADEGTLLNSQLEKRIPRAWRLYTFFFFFLSRATRTSRVYRETLSINRATMCVSKTCRIPS